MSKSLMRSHGLLAVFVICCLPLAIQPLALFAALTQMNVLLFLAAVLSGRTVKYLAMGWMACGGKYLVANSMLNKNVPPAKAKVS